MVVFAPLVTALVFLIVYEIAPGNTTVDFQRNVKLYGCMIGVIATGTVGFIGALITDQNYRVLRVFHLLGVASLLSFVFFTNPKYLDPTIEFYKGLR